MQTRQQKDLELWETWRRTNSNQDLHKLMSNLQPLLFREINKWQASVPVSALESKGRVLMLDALKSYNPNMGAAIATHVTSRLRKISRHVYPYQNVARLPENKQLKFNTFQIAKNKLEEEYGREPTREELSDELTWPIKKVGDFERTFGRRELVESEGAFLEQDQDPSTTLTDFFYRDLAPPDKLLFEDITGYGGKAVLDNQALIRKHKLSQGQLSYKKKRFADKIKEVQQGF